MKQENNMKEHKEQDNKEQEINNKQQIHHIIVKIVEDKINSILYSNRAWVNLKLEKIGAAYDDANHAIKWDPGNIKGYYRRGKANLALLKYEDALIDLEYAYENVYGREYTVAESNNLKPFISTSSIYSLIFFLICSKSLLRHKLSY